MSSLQSQPAPRSEPMPEEMPSGKLVSRDGGHLPYRTLDAWRGIAALCVVAFHAAKAILNRHPALESHFPYAAALYGGLGVQLFFVISGYCITGAAFSALRRSPAAFRSFTAARIRRIYPPCWCALLGAALFGMAASEMVAHGYMRPDVFTQVGIFQHSFLFYFANLTLTQFLLRQPILLDVCWTLCYEVAFYLIVALLLLPPAWAKSGRNVLNALHVMTVLCLMVLLIAPAQSFYPFDLWPQFGLGALVYDLLSHPRQKAPKLWAAILGGLTMLLAILDTGGLGAMQQPARPACLISLLFAALLITLYRHDARLSRIRPVQWLSAVGLFSYSLYLTHTLTLRAFNQTAGFLHFTHPGLLFLAGILMAVAAARVFYQFLERPFIHAKPRG